MPRVAPIVTSFNSGIWGPEMYGRVDLQKYASACRDLTNFIAVAQGAAVRRPGSRFVAASRGNADGVLIPFKFSTVQAYVIEATDLKFRFFMNKGLIESSPGTPYEVTTPYTLADLPDLQWAQSADILYLAHPKYAPRKLSRTGHTSWTLSTISFTATPAEWTGSNYPGSVAFHQQRLFWGGTPAQPQTVWGSRSADFENLTIGSLADDGLKFTMADGEVNKIQWLAGGKAMIAGTAGNEFTVRASTLGEALTPDNTKADSDTTVRAARVMPVRVGNAFLFVQSHKRKLFESKYALENDGQVERELSLLARSVPRRKIRRIAFQQEPWSLVWMCLENGGLVAVTYLAAQEVIGWHVHQLGGTDVKVLSLAAIPGDGQDELWLLVERTIDGTTKRYVEVFENEFLPDDADDKDNAFFVDSGLTYSGAATDTITGLDHLKGQTVQILADGAVHDAQVVSASGAISLSRSVSVAQVGLAYKSRLETMPLEAGSANGTAQTKNTRVVRVGVRFYETLGALVGYDDTDADAMERIEFRDPSMPMDQSPPLFTGDKKVDFPSTWEKDATVIVVQDQPLPCNVSALVPLTQTNDG